MGAFMLSSALFPLVWPLVEDDAGRTPEDIAKRLGNQDSVRVFRNYNVAQKMHKKPKHKRRGNVVILDPAQAQNLKVKLKD